MNRVGRAILDRRLEVGYSTQGEAATAAGIGTTTWGLMEAKGLLPKTPRVRRAISRALNWPAGALDNLASGRNPDHADGPIAVLPQDRLERQVYELTDRVNRIEARLDKMYDREAESGLRTMIRELEQDDLPRAAATGKRSVTEPQKRHRPGPPDEQ